MTREDALKKLERYCDYQDRCHQEVRYRLLKEKVFGDDLEWVITALIDSGHLNEERYARSLVRGKFRIKGWGRVRIGQELKRREIGDYICRKAMEEIDEVAYLAMLEQLLEKRKNQLPADLSLLTVLEDLRKYVLRKGYEWEIIERMLSTMQANGQLPGK